MALSDVKVRSAKPEAKAYKLTDGEGMVLLVHPNGSKYWRLRYRFGGKEICWRWGNTPRFRWRMLDHGSELTVTFSDGSEHYVLLDMELSYWRCTGDTFFDFSDEYRIRSSAWQHAGH